MSAGQVCHSTWTCSETPRTSILVSMESRACTWASGTAHKLKPSPSWSILLLCTFSMHGRNRISEPACCALLLSPQGAYTKFAPVLFPHPDHLSQDNFLKMSKLIYVGSYPF